MGGGRKKREETRKSSRGRVGGAAWRLEMQRKRTGTADARDGVCQGHHRCVPLRRRKWRHCSSAVHGPATHPFVRFPDDDPPAPPPPPPPPRFALQSLLASCETTAEKENLAERDATVPSLPPLLLPNSDSDFLPPSPSPPQQQRQAPSSIRFSRPERSATTTATEPPRRFSCDDATRARSRSDHVGTRGPPRV